MYIESRNEAAFWRRHHRRKLELGKNRHHRIAQSLKNCGPQHPCGTEACRVCVRHLRIRWAGEAIKIIARRRHWTRASIITKGLLVPYGKLSQFDMLAAVRRIRKSIERSGLRGRLVLGALDLSLNTENNVIVGWQFHLYLIVQGRNDAELQSEIKHAFPAEPKALEPYDFALVSDALEAVTYAYKALIERRSGYKDTRGNHRTRKEPLKGADLRVLLPFLARYKAGARLILHGVRRNGRYLARTRSKR